MFSLNNGWYPRNGSWVIHPTGYKYRWRISNGVLTDRLYANPHYSDWECHLEHIHEYNVGVSGHGYTYSIKLFCGADKLGTLRLRERGYFVGSKFGNRGEKVFNIGSDGLRRFFESWNANNR